MPRNFSGRGGTHALVANRPAACCSVADIVRGLDLCIIRPAVRPLNSKQQLAALQAQTAG